MSEVLTLSHPDGNFVLEPMLQITMNTLMPLICAPVNEAKSKSIKNHNEMLRCMEAITRGFPEVAIAFLLSKLEQKDARIRIGALDIIKHIVTRLVKDELANKKSLLVTGVKPIAQTETDNSAKKALAQVVIAMASHSYLGLEGGEYLVEFVVRTSGQLDAPADPKKKEPASEVTVGELRMICDNILNLMTTTIADMIPVLWPYLFETLVDPKFVESTAVVCKNLHHIATIKREADAPDYLIDFDRAVNLPKPAQIIARLLVQLNQPHKRGQLGMRILSLLQSIGPILHPSISDMWDTTLPRLVAYLENNADGPTWNAQKWEDLVLRLLSETIKVANDDQWTMNLGSAYADQLEYYTALPDLKRLCLKHLGMVLQKSSHKEFVRNSLERMVNLTDHASELERDGCAQGFGYASNTHLDIVLERLQQILKGPSTEKKGGFFSSFGGGKKSGGSNRLTVILAFGYVAAYANPAVITSRIDIHIWQHLKVLVQQLKAPLEKATALRAMNLIAEAMHPTRLGQRFVFRQRDEILDIVHAFVRVAPGELDDLVRARAVAAASNLAKLEPPLSPEVETALLGTLIEYLGLPDLATTEAKEIQDGILELFTSILFSNPSVETLIRLLMHLEKWTSQGDPVRRQRATKTLIHLVTEMIEATVKGLKDNFEQVGSALAILVPRCTDPEPGIRQAAVEGVAKILYLDHLLKNKSNPEETPMPEALLPLKELRDGLLVPELNKQFGLIHGMAQVLSKLLPVPELSNLLNGCIRGLNDTQTSSTAGVCVVINGVIKLRGADLKAHVSDLVRGFYSAMPAIKHEQTMNGTLHAVRSLATHHLIPVVNELLLAPQPHSAELIKTLQVLAKDENLVLDFIEHLMDVINNSQLYDEEQADGKGPLVRVPVARAMAATASLGEIMAIEEMQDVVSEHYPRICGTLLLRFGTTVGCVPKKMSLAPEERPPSAEAEKGKKKAPPKPAAPTGATIDSTEQTYASLTALVTCSKDRRFSDALVRERASFSSEVTWVAGLTNLAATVAKTQTDEMRGIFGFLLPYVRGNYVGQKIAAAAILSEFVNHCNGDFELLDKLVSTLLAALIDPPLKIHALRGLGNITSNGKEQANKYHSLNSRYAPTVLDALISSIDDHYEDIAMESMNGLSKVFEIVEVERVAPILVNICHRIRPAFEKRHNAIRAASFQVAQKR